MMHKLDSYLFTSHRTKKKEEWHEGDMGRIMDYQRNNVHSVRLLESDSQNYSLMSCFKTWEFILVHTSKTVRYLA